MGGVSWALLWALLWSCFGLASLVLDQGPNCKAEQYKRSDWCCRKCPPGQRVAAECKGPSTDTVCAPCQEGHFQSSWTQEQECNPHRECSDYMGLELHVPRTPTRQAECRCRRGTHCSGHECRTCQSDSPCGPGKGVRQEATHQRDTVCTDCPEGSFSNVSSATEPCRPWSSCEAQNLVQKERGTPASDVVCDSPPTPLAPPQRDTGRGHLLALLPVATLLLLGGFCAVCCWLRRRGHKKQQQQQHNHQQPEEVLDLEDCPALPIQETLLGAKPVAPEEEAEGKESRLAVQEQV